MAAIMPAAAAVVLAAAAAAQVVPGTELKLRQAMRVSGMAVLVGLVCHLPLRVPRSSMAGAAAARVLGESLASVMSAVMVALAEAVMVVRLPAQVAEPRTLEQTLPPAME